MISDASAPAAPAFKRNDPVLWSGLRAVTLCGVVLGVILYAWLAIRAETGALRQGLAMSAAAGRVAAEAEMTRIDALESRAGPLLAASLAEGTAPGEARAAHAQVTALLADSPVTAIAVLDGKGGVLSVFGQMPADVAGRLGPVSASQRAGRELLALDMVALTPRRAGVYAGVDVAGRGRLPAIYVLRPGAFADALDLGGGAGRAALLNLDGQAVLSSAATGEAVTPADVALAASAGGWRPLHTDETLQQARVGGAAGGTFVETRLVAGGRLKLAYLADRPSVMAVMAARQWEFLALFGVSALALVLALSLIQNEWRRTDAEGEDAFLVLAQARASCDLLDAGVIDWSVADGRLVYSRGWADMFARGVQPAPEDTHEWIGRIHPEDQAGARDRYQSLLDGTCQAMEQRIRVRLPSGLWVQVRERGRVVAGLDGQPARIVLVQTPEAADGSALKEALSALAPPQDLALTA